MNPFEILGLEPGIEVGKDQLEASYLRLSRQYHPDFNQGLAPDQQVAMLTRSAELNDAYHLLRDPWSRAEATLMVLDPEAMDATKTLCPMFLMEAMEAREEVDGASPDDWAGLRATVEARVEQYFHDVATDLTAGKLREAATLVHQSNYYRKALRDLIEKIHAA